MGHNRRLGSLALAALLLGGLLLGGSCSRLADEIYDHEALKIEACSATCDMLDTCDPERFIGMEPEDCYERCMTLMPRLHEENQCGSREIIHLRCLGSLTCEGLTAFTEGNDPSDGPRDYSAPCVTELQWATKCSEEAPFDLDEPVQLNP